MNKRIGFIGCGNMGQAMVGALVASEWINSSDIMVSVRTDISLTEIKNKWSIKVTLDNREVAGKSDILFLAVNPYQYESVINEIKGSIDDQIIVTIAAGIEIAQLREWFGKEVKIVKTMPNTPVLVNAGMSAVCPAAGISREELEPVLDIFQLFGDFEILDEDDFHAFIALCGSSPAYVFVMIEAMADAAVKLGLSRKSAYKMAEQALLGSAKLALETGLHPAELKDMVCSPGGATIEAIVELEKHGFRQTIIRAMEACARKSNEMEDNNQI